MSNKLSFKITSSKIDVRKEIKKRYQQSCNRKKLLNHMYAVALFNSPDKVSDVTNLISVEIGYQKAIKELAGNLVQIL